MNIINPCLLIVFFLFFFRECLAIQKEKKYLSQPELESPLDIIPYVIENVDYIFCIDGGSSKTELQILDKFGNILPLYYALNSESIFIAYGGPSNINEVGEESVITVLTNLFDHLMIGPTRIPLNEVIASSAIVAGIAGLGSIVNREKMDAILQNFNFESSKQALFSDASLTLALIKEEGAILIVGTGCICMSKLSNGIIKRAGGFGFPTQDSCGGLFYGKEAINYAIQDEAGYGDSTSLTNAIRLFFTDDTETNIIALFRSKNLGSKDIASITPLVFDHAYNYQDPLALNIINESIDYLSRIITYCIKDTVNSSFKIFLIGGVFRNQYFNDFIKSISEKLALQSIAIDIQWVNLSHEKIFPRIIQTIIKEKECSVKNNNK